ncbi:gTPase HflX 1 [Clostridium sp. CAG:465]|nr:gTPase HflX 1 [Clostridium sp. CAG:465]
MEEKQKVLLVGVNLNDEFYFFKSMSELEELVKACQMLPIGSIVQNLKEINSAFYVGSGKLEEIKDKINELHPDLVVFNNELSPSQLKNLELKLDIQILDRTSIILNIFALRAKTNEAKMQVEIAKLRYMLPRLSGLHLSLGRQGGGSGFSNKGSGEKQIELDRRIIEDRISKLNKELSEIETRRNIQRRKRSDSQIPLVSLVGYTNAGKSTLLNALVDLSLSDESKKVYEEDMLFATLETSIRKIKIKDGKEFLLSDTVGFIRELPHMLIKAFRSTLDEVKNSDLLLHVVDFSDEDYEENIRVTNSTLKEIGADNIPVIYVFNKCDKVNDSKLPYVDGNKVCISAKNNIGINELINVISNNIFKEYVTCKMQIPFKRGDIVSYLKEKYDFISTQYTNDGTLIEICLNKKDYGKYKNYIIEE